MDDPDIYRLVFENANTGICLVDLAGRLLRVNSRLAEMLGYSPQELEGRAVDDVTLPADGGIGPGWLERALAGRGDRAQFEKRYVHKQGRIVWGQVSSTLIRDAGGTPLYVISQVQDITAQKRAQEELERLNAELEDRVEQRTLALSLRAAELEALLSLSSALRQAVTLDDVVRIILDLAVHALEADTGLVLLLEAGSLVVAGVHGLPDTLLGRRHLPCADLLWQAAGSGQPILFDAAGRGALAGSDTLRMFPDDLAAMAVVPLQAAQETLGMLAITFQQPRPPEEYGRTLTAMAEVGGNALQRARAMDSLEHLIRDRTRDLAALYEVTTMTTQHLDTQVILERVLEKALSVVGGEAGIIHLLNKEGETPRLTVPCAIPPRLVDWVGAQNLGTLLWDQVVDRKETIILVDWPEALSTSWSAYLEQCPAYIGVPIFAAGRMLGVLSVFGKEIQEFSAEDVALLAAIANHVGAAVDGARLRHLAEEAAVMEERQRVAREMHDSVTQSLYSLTLFAEAAQDSTRAADFARAQHYLNRLGETAQQALKEMRLLIYQLHPLALTRQGLVGALQQRLDAVERRAGVEAQIVQETPLTLTPRLEAGLYRMAQETLNNVLKHANASQVLVRLRADEDGVRLQVADNGRGFDPDSIQDRAGLGLASIRERAAALDGTVHIASAPGTGTTVTVTIPLAARGSNQQEVGL